MSAFPLTDAEWATLEAYADDSLPAEDRSAVEARLAADPSFQAALAEHQLLVAGIRSYGRAALRDRLRRVAAELRESEAAQVPAPAPAPRSVPVMRVSWVRRWRPLAAAAALVLAGGLGTWLLLRQPGYQATADRFAVADPGLPVLMAPSRGATQKLIDEAMNAYKLNDAATALQTWNALPAGAVGPDTLLYYRGIFQLRTHQNAQAEAAMRRLQALPSTAFRERADYYFAVALWAQGRIDEARTAFERLTAIDGHPYAADARRALEQL